MLSSKRAVSNTMFAVLKDNHFSVLLADDGGDDNQGAVLKGTHSMRRFAAQYACNKGCSRDDLDYQFRWLNKRIQYQYV